MQEQRSTITVKRPDGQLVEINRSELRIAVNAGYVVPSNEEINRYNALIDAGEGINPLIAGAESAASAATFGLSRKAGVTSQTMQALRQEANPQAEAIGIIIGFFLLTATICYGFRNQLRPIFGKAKQFSRSAFFVAIILLGAGLIIKLLGSLVLALFAAPAWAWAMFLLLSLP
jgi:hypothetical protein